MNRFVLVGNGFDLAFGLKTKYEDFLKDYLIKHIKNLETNSNEISEDDLVKVEFLKSLRYVDYGKGRTKIIDLFDNLKIQDIINNEDISWKWSHNRKEVTKNNKSSKLIKIELKSRLFSKLIGDGKWTDVEKAYFDELLEAFKIRNEEGAGLLLKVVKLNKDFEILKSKIIDYLNEINKPISDNFSYSDVFQKCFDVSAEKYFKRYISKESYAKNKNLDNLFFVNFNYTKLLSDTRCAFRKKIKIKVVH